MKQVILFLLIGTIGTLSFAKTADSVKWNHKVFFNGNVDHDFRKGYFEYKKRKIQYRLLYTSQLKFSQSKFAKIAPLVGIDVNNLFFPVAFDEGKTRSLIYGLDAEILPFNIGIVSFKNQIQFSRQHTTTANFVNNVRLRDDTKGFNLRLITCPTIHFKNHNIGPYISIEYTHYEIPFSNSTSSRELIAIKTGLFLKI